MDTSFKGVVDGLSTAVVIIRAKSGIPKFSMEYANPAFAQLIDFPLNSFQKEDIESMLPWTCDYINRNIVSPEEPGFLTEIITGTPYWISIRLLEDNEFLIEINYSPWHESPQGAEHSSSESIISTLKKTIINRITKEEILLRENAYMHQLLDALPLVAAIKDSNLRYRFVNKFACQTLNLGPDDILGQTDDLICTPEEADHFRSVDRIVLSEQRVLEREDEYTDKEGKVHHLLTRKTPVYDRDGKICVQMVAWDITELKQTQELLHKITEQFLNCARETAGVFWMLDISGDLLFVSPSIENLLGYPSDVFLQMKPTDYYTADTVNQLRLEREYLTTLLNNNQIQEAKHFRCLKVDMIHQNGSIIPCEMRFAIITDADKRISAFQGFVFRT